MSKFNDVLTEFKDDLKKIDEIILQFASGKSPLIQEVSQHLVNSGGKRIRPILLLLAAKICKTEVDDKKSCYHLAAAVELIHSATLLHDDVVDASQIRRGKKTANAIWENKVSILVGDYLFSIAFQLMVFSKNLSILNLLAKSSSIMADGEVMQLENSSDLNISEEKYFEIIFGKTAILFSAACEVGAMINGFNREEASALRNFGKNLGIIFQIVDDILDYSSQEQVLGKDLGNDFFEGKVTLPIILTYKKCDESEKKIIDDFFVKNLLVTEKNQSNLDKILQLIKKHNGLEDCKNRGLSYRKMAIDNLSIFPDSPEKSNLLTILEYSLSRIS